MTRLVFSFLLFGGITSAAEPDVRIIASEIDALLEQDWQKHSLQGNAPASDEIFVRRIHLDLVGRIPTHQETVSFLGAADKDKRPKLIDKLLAREGFTMHQFHIYADLLRVLSKGTYNGDAGALRRMTRFICGRPSMR